MCMYLYIYIYTHTHTHTHTHTYTQLSSAHATAHSLPGLAPDAQNAAGHISLSISMYLSLCLCISKYNYLALTRRLPLLMMMMIVYLPGLSPDAQDAAGHRLRLGARADCTRHGGARQDQRRRVRGHGDGEAGQGCLSRDGRSRKGHARAVNERCE